MKEIKKMKGNKIITKIIDDNKNLVKLEIVEVEGSISYSFVNNYEYDEKNRLVHYYNNEGGDLKYEYDDKDRIIWKREKVTKFTDSTHYIYKDDTDEVIKLETMYGNGRLLIVLFEDDDGIYSISFETDNLDTIKEITDYAKNEGLIIDSSVLGRVYEQKIYRVIITVVDLEDLNEIKRLLNIEEV